MGGNVFAIPVPEGRNLNKVTLYFIGAPQINYSFVKNGRIRKYIISISETVR